MSQIINNNRYVMLQDEEVIITKGHLVNAKGEYKGYDPIEDKVLIKIGTITHRVPSNFIEPINKERLYLIYTLGELNQLIYERTVVATSEDEVKSLCRGNEEYLALDSIDEFDVILRKRK